MQPTRFLTLVLSASLLTLGSSSGWSQTETTLPLTDDAWIKGSEPERNTGEHPRITVGRWGPKQGLVRFDGASIAGQTIREATLQLFLSGIGTPGDVSVHAITSGWNESAVTWNMQPPAEDTPLAVVALAEADERRVVAIDVTDAVQAWADGTSPAAGFVLKTSRATVVQFHSKETRGGTPPMLEVITADEPPMPFADASIFFELNDTDGDLGIHALIDGEPWRTLQIQDPAEQDMLNIGLVGRLQLQGLTEIFFESAEPPFESDDPDEVTLTPEQFFERFPEGEYAIDGTTLERAVLESVAEVTHLMPAPAENVMVSGVPAAEDCDVVPLPSVSRPISITWDPVTQSHPDLGRSGEDIEVEHYQVVVEQEDLGLALSVELPPDVTELEIPPGFAALGETFKFEILIREASGNQTASESCFDVEP